MRKLLNTLYVTNEQCYLSLEGENIVMKEEDKVIFRLPFDNLENIVCFNYLGVSPALMGKCVNYSIPINFLTPTGKFLAKVFGETKGNVFLRVAQLDCFKENSLKLTQNTMAAKFLNTLKLIKRSLHDYHHLRKDTEIIGVMERLKQSIERVYEAEDVSEILGIEGNSASAYFSIFNKLLRAQDDVFKFQNRTKRPPLDPVNTMLSFVYTIYTSEVAAALETVGLDSYIGYYHTLRSGRESLACDLIEELRCLVERFVIGMINLGEVKESDFDFYVSGEVYLNNEGRRKVLTKWQERKRKEVMHPYINEKIAFGLIPYVQSNLLAKYIRGDLEEYPCFLLK